MRWDHETMRPWDQETKNPAPARGASDQSSEFANITNAKQNCQRILPPHISPHALSLFVLLIWFQKFDLWLLAYEFGIDQVNK